MARNTATATWDGGKEGAGRVQLGGGAFEGSYTFKSRFEGEGPGTNPEELVAAAHAACFSMAVTAELGRAGIESDSVQTEAQITLKMVDGKPTLTKSQLTTTVRAPGQDEAKVREAAEAAKTGCPISRALDVEEIALDLTVEV